MAKAAAVRTASKLTRRSTRAELDGEDEALAEARLVAAFSELELMPPAVREGLGPVAEGDLMVCGPLDEAAPGVPPTAASLLPSDVDAESADPLALEASVPVGDALPWDDPSLVASSPSLVAADPLVDSLEALEALAASPASAPDAEADAPSPPTEDVADACPGEVKPRPPLTPSLALPSEQVLVSPAAQPWKRPPTAGLLASDRTHWSPWMVPESWEQQMESSGSTVVHETVLAILGIA